MAIILLSSGWSGLKNRWKIWQRTQQPQDSTYLLLSQTHKWLLTAYFCVSHLDAESQYLQLKHSNLHTFIPLLTFPQHS